MAREYAIPSSSTILQDYGLTVKTPPTARNRRVVIIGTAEDGPLYEPIAIDQPQDSELVWGRQLMGDLVRGIFECWNSQNSNQNVVGVRIGKAETSILEIPEIHSDGVDEEDSDENIVSLRLKGRNPGPIYDQITIQYDSSMNHAGDISIYNPKTGAYSYFSVDRTNPYNTSVDVHNISELVTAINNDRNLAYTVVAEYDELVTDYELVISGLTPGVIQSADSVRLNLSQILAESGVIASGNDAFLVTDPDLPYDINGIDYAKNLTVANNLINLESVTGIGISEWTKQEFKGIVTKLEHTPLDGKNNSRWDSIQALKDYDGDSKYITSPGPSGQVISEYLYNVEFALINEIPTDFKGLDEQNVFTFDIDIPLDDTENPGMVLNDSVAFKYISINHPEYNDYQGTGDYEDARCIGVETKKVDGKDERPYGAVRVFVSNKIDNTAQWTEVPYHSQSGVYISEFIEDNNEGNKLQFAIGPAASGCYDINNSHITFDTGIPDTDPIKWSNLTQLIDKDGFIQDGVYIRVTGNTVKGFLTEVDTLSQLEASMQTARKPTYYFLRGDELVLNAAPNFPMIINYGIKINYEIGTTVAITDYFNGELTFLDRENLPGPGGGRIEDDKITHIRLNYKYMPNFPAITSKAKSLHGGKTGAKLSVKEREEELIKAYDYLRNFEADIWVPMGAYIDAIKEDYNENTGLLEKQMNSFSAGIEDFLVEQSINQYQPHAILGVTQVEGETLGDKDEWVKNLTEYDIDDPLRGANSMAAIQSKYISVAAFEPIFMNTGRGAPYAANGQAAYAGLIASLPYDISPTNKPITGITATRFNLAIPQLEALNNFRYVTMKNTNTRNPVIVNDITAAPYGSDYVNWSIFSITKEAADRIKRVADSYIGRPNSMEVRNALDQDISNVLKNMSGIQAFNFNLSSTIDQQILGVIEIDLVIVPVFTIKKIRTTIKLRKNVALG